ncbi:MAG: glycosyltransferase WbuB [Massilioclostridium sp.]|nr:MAG: glycosyltransferase WbuB [Massilioclostridium sp.]
MSEKKNLWIFCHYAQQPPYNTMLRYHNWGKYIQEEGYDVTIVAASTVHNTDIDVVEKLTGKTEDVVDGVRYLYIKTPKYVGNGISRVKNMLAYCLGLGRLKKIDRQPDYVVLCEAYLYPFVHRAYRKLPIITDIVDLWPLSIVEYTSVSNNNPLIRFLYWLEKIDYIKSDALIFSMEGGLDYVKEQPYAKRVDIEKIYHINMGCDLDAFDGQLTVAPKLERKDFIITYCGSMRQANNIIQICESAKLLRDKGLNVRFHFYGNGPDEITAKEFCSNNDLYNVEFFGRFKKEDLANILSKSTVNIMTYKQTKVMKYGGSQSKLFDYLASGKPIINCGSWGYNLVSRYNCGEVVEEQTCENIAAAIEKLYYTPIDELTKMGRQARIVAEKYSQPMLVGHLISILETFD